MTSKGDRVPAETREIERGVTHVRAEVGFFNFFGNIHFMAGGGC